MWTCQFYLCPHYDFQKVDKFGRLPKFVPIAPQFCQHFNALPKSVHYQKHSIPQICPYYSPNLSTLELFLDDSDAFLAVYGEGYSPNLSLLPPKSVHLFNPLSI